MYCYDSIHDILVNFGWNVYCLKSCCLFVCWNLIQWKEWHKNCDQPWLGESVGWSIVSNTKRLRVHGTQLSSGLVTGQGVYGGNQSMILSHTNVSLSLLVSLYLSSFLSEIKIYPLVRVKKCYQKEGSHS